MFVYSTPLGTYRDPNHVPSRLCAALPGPSEPDEVIPIKDTLLMTTEKSPLKPEQSARDALERFARTSDGPSCAGSDLAANPLDSGPNSWSRPSSGPRNATCCLLAE